MCHLKGTISSKVTLVGGRYYQFASVREFFEDEEVASTLDDQQDSLEAVGSLA